MSFEPHSAGTVIASAATETPMTALNGTRSRLIRRNRDQPGIARSRENAYQVRDALVRPAATQKICPIVAIRNTIFAAHGSSEMLKISPTKPPASLTASTSLAANRNARITNHPITADQNTDRHTP